MVLEWADEEDAKCCMGDGQVTGDCYDYYDLLKSPEMQIYYLFDTTGHWLSFCWLLIIFTSPSHRDIKAREWARSVRGSSVGIEIHRRPNSSQRQYL